MARGAPFYESGIARQEDAPLVLGELHQIGVLDGPKIDGVVSQDSQPPGEPAEHAVGGEAERGVFDSPGALC